MHASVSADDYRKLQIRLREPSADNLKGVALETTIRFINQQLDEKESNITAVIHKACNATGLKQKTFMVANRHALSAVKVSYLRVPVVQY